MAHVSGLRPDVDLADAWTGYDAALELARNEVPTSAPGERFVYSDINFFLLGEIVRVVSGRPLDEYTRTAIFEPLGMRDTGFKPAESLRPRIAPTERCEEMDQWPCKRPEAPVLRGVVHDPTARRMGGVAGHAGLFGTAADLARFARMLLGGGALEGRRVLSPATVARMTSRATPVTMAAARGLGWDIDTTFSSNRGELFPIGSYGHTGFTGTSLWMDPASGGYVVFLSSRLHPDGTGDVTPLRARVASVAAAAMLDVSSAPRTGVPTLATASVPPPQPPAPVLAGIDVLARDGFKVLQGKKVGLLTNHTGIDRNLRSSIDILHAGWINLVALFSRNGIRGTR
jgi:CubicO group peptidase (beta-lactamase class C family)